MRDIRSVKDNFHGLEQIQGHFVLTCPIHDVSHLKFNRCPGSSDEIKLRVASSEYFMRKFKISSGLRSRANIIKSVGPIPEPCMIDRL